MDLFTLLCLDLADTIGPPEELRHDLSFDASRDDPEFFGLLIESGG